MRVRLWNDYLDDFHDVRIVSLSQMSVLRRRNKPTSPCIEDIGHDISLMEIAKKQLRCMPPYWKPFTKENLEQHYCNTLSQLKASYGIIMKWNKISSLSTPPCDTMTIHIDKDPPLQYGMGETSSKNLTFYLLFEPIYAIN